MAVAYGLHGELLHVRTQHIELALRGLQRGIERRLIAFVERAQVDGLHRRIELLLALSLAIGIGGDEQFGGHDFLTQDGRIGTRSPAVQISDAAERWSPAVPPQQPTVPEGNNAHGDQQFLSRLRRTASA